ncbi:MAG: protein kinase [Bryobacterales bacterium]|nr:protein kinase [Bryobacterales bacterium]
MTARTDHPHYEILEPLGEGGMGVVFKARDKRLNRIVALKFLAPAQAHRDDALRRFEREALAIAALNHPNIAVVYEVGEWDGSPFLALEYLPGGTLKKRCRGRRLAPAELLHYAAQVGRALAYAHEQGILHRDIKAGNVMFGEQGDLKLVDFGLAKWRDAEDATRTGAMVGTIPYMSPELLDGEPATAQSDLYAFGALVYELAAGQPMFGGERTETLIRRIVTGEITPLATVRPDLPTRITAAVARATTPDPRQRYSSVREFMRDLGPGLSGSGSADLAEPETVTMPLRQTGTARRRWRLPRVWIYAPGAVLAIAGVFGIEHWWRAPAPLKTLVVLPLEELGNAPEGRMLADGLQESITDTLANAPSLRESMLVVPSAEVRRNQIKTIADAHKQFNADLAIAGTIEKNAESLRLTLNLADAGSLRQQGTRVLELRPEEMAALQDRLGDELGALLSAGPVKRAGQVAPGETTHNAAAYRLYVEGKGALQSRDLDKAIEDLKMAVDLDPQFMPARANLAESYFRKYTQTKDGKWLALADAEASEAAQRGDSKNIAFVQAMIWRATGQAERAIPVFRGMVQRDPDNMDARTALAQVLQAAGRTQEAEAAFQAAIRQRPGYWPTYQLLGTFYFGQHENAKAEQAYLTGIAVAPGVPAMHSNLGAVYFSQGKWDDAAREFDKSVSLKPYALGYANLGTVRFYQGRYSEAAEKFEEATRLQPANPVNWGNLGDALWQLPGSRERAREAFDKGAVLASEELALNPGNFGLRKSYALYVAKLGRTKEALKEIEQALKQAPKDRDVQYWAARVYAITGDIARAKSALQAALALGYDRHALEHEPDLKALSAEAPKSTAN